MPDRYVIMMMVADAFAELVCTKRGGKARPLFSKKACSAWTKLLNYVEDGMLTPPEGFARSLSNGKCPNSGLRTYHSLVGTSGLENHHNMQRDASTPGMSIACADLNLHQVVERNNVNAQVRNMGKRGHGCGRIYLYRREVIARIQWLRAEHAGFFHEGDPYPDFVPPREEDDNGERFGLAYKNRRDYDDAAGAAEAEMAWERMKALQGIDQDAPVQVGDVVSLYGLLTGAPVPEAVTDELDGLTYATCGPRGAASVQGLSELVYELIQEHEPADMRSLEDVEMLVAKHTGADLGEDGEVDADTTAGEHGLEAAYLEYGRLLAGAPTELNRDYKTGRTVQQRINALHGVDEDYGAGGIYTPDGLELMLQIWKELKKKKPKVKAAEVKEMWNERVKAMIDSVDVAVDEDETEMSAGDVEKEQTILKQRYGFIKETSARIFTDQVEKRELTLALIKKIEKPLIEIFRRQKKVRAEAALVAELPEVELAPVRECNPAIAGNPSPLAAALTTVEAANRTPVDPTRTCWYCFEARNADGSLKFADGEMDKCLFKEKNANSWIGINGHKKVKQTRKSAKGSGSGAASSSSKGNQKNLGLKYACPTLTKETGEAYRRPTSSEREQYTKLYNKHQKKSRRTIKSAAATTNPAAPTI